MKKITANKSVKAIKIITLMLIMAISVSLIAGCTASTGDASSSLSSQAVSTASSAVPTVTNAVKYEDRTLIKIATLKGPTGMGMVKLFSDNEAKTSLNRYTPLIVGAPDEIVSKISSGEIDIAAVPTNLAATLYNKTNGKIQILALNTLGVLNILEKGETVKSIADLKGKTLYASGKGSTPEFILDYLLQQNGIDPVKDITIIYKTEHAELATLALTGGANLVMLPEPFVTTVLSKNAGFKNVIDMTEEWEKTTLKTGIKDSVLSMGCVIVRKEFAQANKAAVDSFLTEYKASIDYTNQYLDETSVLVAKYGIMASAALAKVAIPNCHIVFIEGEVMKAQIANLYNIFFMADPKSIGGKLPGDDFYYIG
ncbi:MAG: ABC transporter substrate-binding protein [Saccharofermentanales bacterium]